MSNTIPTSELPKSWKQKAVSFIMHVACIFILFILPEIIMSIGDTRHDSIPTGVYVKTIIYIAVFYINYFFIFNSCFNKPHSTIRFIGYNLILFIGAMAIIYFSWKINASHLPVHSEYPPINNLPPNVPDPTEFKAGEFGHMAMSLTRYLRDAIILVLTITLCLAIKLSNKWIAIEKHKEASKASQREDELKSLRNQINPHFLFNSLNSIYALIDICPDTAKHAVHELSHMLRYVLYENPATVTLKQEIKFIESYISLMKLRLGNNVTLNVTLNSNGHDDLAIAPLLFVTIIENVFKHGNTGNASMPIDISISAKDKIVKCHTFNHFNNSPSSTGGGIGLANLRRRINLLYGDKAALTTSATQYTFTVDLTINLNN